MIVKIIQFHKSGFFALGDAEFALSMTGLNKSLQKIIVEKLRALKKLVHQKTVKTKKKDASI